MSKKNKKKFFEKYAEKIVLLAVPNLIERWKAESPDVTFDTFVLEEYKKIRGEQNDEK